MSGTMIYMPNSNLANISIYGSSSMLVYFGRQVARTSVSYVYFGRQVARTSVSYVYFGRQVAGTSMSYVYFGRQVVCLFTLAGR